MSSVVFNSIVEVSIVHITCFLEGGRVLCKTLVHTIDMHVTCMNIDIKRIDNHVMLLSAYAHFCVNTCAV